MWCLSFRSRQLQFDRIVPCYDESGNPPCQEPHLYRKLEVDSEILDGFYTPSLYIGSAGMLSGCREGESSSGSVVL